MGDVCIDLMGPFPRSKQGNCYLLVVTDYLSKITLMWPLRKPTGLAVSRNIENKIVLEFLKLLSVRMKFSIVARNL